VAVETEEIAGHYVLVVVNDRTPPLDRYEGCASFPTSQRSICTIQSGRLHLQVTRGFRLTLVPPSNEIAPTVVKGGYAIGGRSVHYTSGVHGEFGGMVLALDECAVHTGFGPAVTFERAGVRLVFCRDPANASASGAR
jgi:hypothetical protein